MGYFSSIQQLCTAGKFVCHRNMNDHLEMLAKKAHISSGDGVGVGAKLKLSTKVKKKAFLLVFY